MTVTKEEILALEKEASLLRKEFYENLGRMEKETEAMKLYMKELTKKFEYLGLVQGEMAEDAISRSVDTQLLKYGIDVHGKVIRNAKVGDRGEYDILAVNKKEVVVIEVKNKVRKDHIEYLIKVQLPKFKELFPEYKSFKVYGGIGGLVIKDNIEEEAKRLGLFVFSQNGNVFEIRNKKGFKPKVYA